MASMCLVGLCALGVQGFPCFCNSSWSNYVLGSEDSPTVIGIILCHTAKHGAPAHIVVKRATASNLTLVMNCGCVCVCVCVCVPVCVSACVDFGSMFPKSKTHVSSNQAPHCRLKRVKGNISQSLD